MFNVPHGRTATKNGVKDNHISIPDITIFENAKKLFKESNTTFSSVNFQEALSTVKKGDVVYLDPPYYDSVNYYNEIDFTHENQKELRDEMVRLTELGAHVIMSNSKSKESKKLFTSKYFDIKEIPVTRTIQRKKKANHQYKEDKEELFITSCL
jgi:DNA adenine methylase